MLYVWQRLLKVRLNTFQEPNILQFQAFEILSSYDDIVNVYPQVIFTLGGFALQSEAACLTCQEQHPAAPSLVVPSEHLLRW